MKICMFTNTYLPHVGGVANSISRFTEDLRRLDHHVLILAPTYPEVQMDAEDAGVLHLPAIQNFNGSDFSIRIPIPFIIDEKIDAFRPDIIHSHHPYLLGDSAVRAARRRNLPIVFTHHTLYEKYTHYIAENNEVMARFAANLSTAYANLCTHVVAPSESIARLIQKRGVETPVTVIPTGVDVDFFESGERDKSRKSYGFSADTPVVGHVGRLAPEKNISFLAEAVVRYVQQEAGAHFLVVGNGPCRADIKKIFKEAGIGDRLILAGEKTGQALADAYAAMDVFVFASMTETQGMVLTEAMAAGNPVIALDAPGVREVVVDRKNGALLSENTSPAVFAEAIREFFQNQEKADAWKQTACRTAKKFERTVCADRLVALYESIQKSKSASARQSLNEFISWDEMLNAIKAEWELAAEKARAVVDTVKEDRPAAE